MDTIKYMIYANVYRTYINKFFYYLFIYYILFILFIYYIYIHKLYMWANWEIGGHICDRIHVHWCRGYLCSRIFLNQESQQKWTDWRSIPAIVVPSGTTLPPASQQRVLGAPSSAAILERPCRSGLDVPSPCDDFHLAMLMSCHGKGSYKKNFPAQRQNAGQNPRPCWSCST